MDTTRCGKQFSARARAKAIRLIERGVSFRRTAKQVGCSKAAVQYWIAKHRASEQPANESAQGGGQ
jgi:predicted transcriptional regulator